MSGNKLFIGILTGCHCIIGDSLGKSSTSGRTEPVPITIKDNRSGLGREKLIQEIKEKKQKMRLERLQKAKEQGDGTSTEQFRY